MEFRELKNPSYFVPTQILRQRKLEPQRRDIFCRYVRLNYVDLHIDDDMAEIKMSNTFDRKAL